jgi:Uma2 family endonuclease
MLSSSPSTATPNHTPPNHITNLDSTELEACGWKLQEVIQPDGEVDFVMIPLTEEEFLHPQEGYRLPNSTFHGTIAGDLKDMLSRRYANRPDVGIFQDLLICWDVDLGDHCPDGFVAFGIREKEQNLTQFRVEQEGVRPSLIVEVVSPCFRRTDRETKVMEYAIAGVQEYVICDRRRVRKQLVEEVLGYRLKGSHYQPISPDEEGRILCQTVGLWISLREGQIVLEDAETGERLKTSQELAQENQEMAQENQEMAALLARYRQQFGDLPENEA